MDMDIPAGFHIDAVAVLRICGIYDPDAAHSQVLAEIGVHIPGRRVLQSDVLDQNIAAVAQAHHHRPVEVVVGRGCCQSFFKGIIVSGIDLSRDRGIEHIPGGEPDPSFLGFEHIGGLSEQFFPLPGSHLEFLDRTPQMAVSVDDAVSGNSNILCVFRADQTPYRKLSVYLRKKVGT